ncbi:MAG: SDR family oxidoreductase [Candidatus Eremiobacteraeota bacterium]|nr:SDR family oxidoreductase [Candidatus Eremiobacteraeota bacterium]
MSAISLQGKHALITGGGRGIGLATAHALSRHGVRLTLLSREISEDDVRATGLRDFIALRCDVTDGVAVNNAFASARNLHGGVEILINNAGIAKSAPFARTEPAMWDHILAVNLTGTYLCTKAAVNDMLAAGFGRIVNIASTAGLCGAPYISAYSASKHAVVGLTRSLAEEYQHHNVTVNAVCPGYTDTDMMAQAVGNIAEKTGLSQQQAREQLAQSNVQGRLVQPQEVAETVLALCEATSSGACVVLPGGEFR